MLDPTTGECEASTTVTGGQGGASSRPEKLARVEDTELGTFSSTGDGECVAGEDGFYAFPCVPTTKPASDEVWRLHDQNMGTFSMAQLLVVDKLPTPGDTGAGTRSRVVRSGAPCSKGGASWSGAPGA